MIARAWHGRVPADKANAYHQYLLLPDMLYFHAYWRREHRTVLGDDFRVLPAIKGRGRYLGTVVGVETDATYGDTWWGDGEMKIVLNAGGRKETLVGTGTEDYVLPP
jgi:D-arabinan exo alpha-(1,3)/(1,5)-arabinofuranosidase (non-reducing end)